MATIKPRYLSASEINDAKNRARIARRRSEGKVKHGQALDIEAKRFGFSSWAQMMEEIAVIGPSTVCLLSRTSNLNEYSLMIGDAALAVTNAAVILAAHDSRQPQTVVNRMKAVFPDLPFTRTKRPRFSACSANQHHENTLPDFLEYVVYYSDYAWSPVERIYQRKNCMLPQHRFPSEREPRLGWKALLNLQAMSPAYRGMDLLGQDDWGQFISLEALAESMRCSVTTARQTIKTIVQYQDVITARFFSFGLDIVADNVPVLDEIRLYHGQIYFRFTREHRDFVFGYQDLLSSNDIPLVDELPI